MSNTQNDRFALLVDGAFLVKKFSWRKKAFPVAQDIKKVCDDICALPELADQKMFRTYFYHSRPATKELTNPIDRTKLNLGNSSTYRNHDTLIKGLEMTPGFAIRLGQLPVHGWKIGPKSMQDLFRNPRPIQANDLMPNIQQKGVDLKIGLDIAKLSLQHIVESVIVVTGDSDLIPALKFARREGIRVFLCCLDHGVNRELKVHADVLLTVKL